MSRLTETHMRWLPRWIGNDLTPDRLMGPMEGFKTRRLCKKYIDETWGYIRRRKDLRGPPHYWRVPRPVKVSLVITEQSNEP